MPDASRAAGNPRPGARLLFGISVFWFALSLLFDGLTVLVLPATLGGLLPDTNRAAVLGLVTFAGLLAAMLVQPVAGLLSDRLQPALGRRGFVALGTIGILAGLATYGAAAAVAERREGLDAIVLVAVGYLVVQLGASGAQAGQQGFIPDLVPAAWRGRAAGLRSALDVAGAFAAFVVLGSLLEDGGPVLATAGIGLVVAVAFGLTATLVREPRSRRPGRAVSIRRSFSLAPDRSPTLVPLVVSRFLFLLATYSVGRFFLFFVAERLGLSPEDAVVEAGSLLAALTLLTVLASVPAGWLADRLGRTTLMVAGAGAGCAGALLLVAAQEAWQILLFGGLLSMASAAFAPANWAATADVVPREEAGRHMALANFGTAGAAACAGLAGVLVDGVRAAGSQDPYAALLLVAAGAFALSAVPVVATHARPQLPVAPDEQVGRLGREA